MPDTIARAVYTLPAAVAIRQRPIVSSHSMSSTEQPNRMCAPIPYLRAHWRMYSHISGCGANMRDQPGLSSNENEYMWDGTSHAHPGYLLSRHVPPRSSFFSRITKWW